MMINGKLILIHAERASSLAHDLKKLKEICTWAMFKPVKNLEMMILLFWKKQYMIVILHLNLILLSIWGSDSSISFYEKSRKNIFKIEDMCFEKRKSDAM